jgi:hypothetical protein
LRDRGIVAGTTSGTDSAAGGFSTGIAVGLDSGRGGELKHPATPIATVAQSASPSLRVVT